MSRQLWVGFDSDDRLQMLGFACGHAHTQAAEQGVGVSQEG